LCTKSNRPSCCHLVLLYVINDLVSTVTVSIDHISMTTNEILAQWKQRGATRDFLYHLERSGYLKPSQLTRGRTPGRSYPPHEIRKLDIILAKRAEGLSLKAAFLAASTELAAAGFETRPRILIVEEDAV